MNEKTVFVGGISWKASEENLRTFFSSFGTVTDCKIIVDKNSNKSKGYGFVTFEEIEVANRVKKSKDLNFMGKTMNASDAYRKSETLSKSPNIPPSNIDYQNSSYVPYTIPVPYYVPGYNSVPYVPYPVYPYYGWPGVPDYYGYQPYDYENYEEGDGENEANDENDDAEDNNNSNNDKNATDQPPSMQKNSSNSSNHDAKDNHHKKIEIQKNGGKQNESKSSNN